MKPNIQTFSRAEVADQAGLDSSQLEYLIKQGILVPDIGGKRKKFSRNEATLAVIAGAFLPHVSKHSILKEPIALMRDYIRWPDVKMPDSIQEIGAFLCLDHLRERRSTGKFDENYHIERARIDLFPARYPALGFEVNRLLHGKRIKELRSDGRINVDALIAAVDAEIYLEMEKEPILSEDEWLKAMEVLKFWRAVEGLGNFYLMFSISDQEYWFQPSSYNGIRDGEDLPSPIVSTLDVKRLFSKNRTSKSYAHG